MEKIKVKDFLIHYNVYYLFISELLSGLKTLGLNENSEIEIEIKETPLQTIIIIKINSKTFSLGLEWIKVNKIKWSYKKDNSFHYFETSLMRTHKK